MNIIGLVFAGVVVIVMLFFGLTTVHNLDEGSNISTNSTMYNEYNTAVEVTKQTFNFMGFIPYLIFIVALFGVLLLFAKLI